MHFGGVQLEKAKVGPTSGPTWRRTHLRRQDPPADVVYLRVGAGPGVHQAAPSTMVQNSKLTHNGPKYPFCLSTRT
jgi:hypothetical protein